MPDSPDPAYTVNETDDHRFEVIGPSGASVCRCAARIDAEHYAAMVNAAYKSGFKAGYREARNPH